MKRRGPGHQLVTDNQQMAWHGRNICERYSAAGCPTCHHQHNRRRAKGDRSMTALELSLT